MLIGAAVLGVIKGGHTDEVLGALSDTRNAAANSVGFRITRWSRSPAANSSRRMRFSPSAASTAARRCCSSNAATARDKLKADPWISDATVQKLYPGRLQIDITERSPFALWQENGRVSVISADGTVLEPYVARRFVSLPLGRGQRCGNPRQGFPRPAGAIPAGAVPG